MSSTVAGDSPRRGSPGSIYGRAVSFLVVLTFLLLTIVFTLSHGRISDPDIWWHLHNADYLVQHHALPRADTYSFTVAGHPWMNHEWLAEVPYYLGWKAWGLQGIDAVTVGILWLTFLGMLYLAYQESRNYKSAIAACCFSVFLCSVSFGPRTILFGYALMVVLLIVLQQLRLRGHAPLWVLPVLFCIWVNTHGSWLIGMILFSIVIAGGWAPLRWGLLESEAWTPNQRKNLLWAWGASAAALFVNPFGYRLVIYPLDLAFRQKLNIQHVAEWVSVDFHDLRGRVVMVLLFVLLLSAILRPRRWLAAETGILLFALYSGLTYIRFQFLLGLVVAPILAKILDFFPSYRRDLDTPKVNLGAIILMIAGMAYFWPTEKQLDAKISEQYPVGAMKYLDAHPAQGNLLNFYLWGGYVNWKQPATKIFLDSRVDIFEYSGVLKDYLDLLDLVRVQPILEQYQIRYVLFPKKEKLTTLLERDAEWKLIYSDDLSELFEKTNVRTASPATP